MSLFNELDTYLQQRRNLGYELKTTEYLLRSFCHWMAEKGNTRTFTTDDALEWATSHPNTAPVWSTQRLTAVRPFAAWLNARGHDVPLIAKNLLPSPTTRRLPYIYSQTDLERILNACSTFYPHPRVAATMRTIIGLLAVTGMRIGEALRLKIGDLDVDNHLLLVHGRKTALDRYVVLHPTTTKTLTTYLACPERIKTAPSAAGPIFVNARGRGFVTETIEQHFRTLTDSLHLVTVGQKRPRLHDLRHTFATRHMIAAYTHGRDPARTLSLLATWLGHSSPEHTCWYLSAAPELLAAAANRLETIEEDHRHD